MWFGCGGNKGQGDLSSTAVSTTSFSCAASFWTSILHWPWLQTNRKETYFLSHYNACAGIQVYSLSSVVYVTNRFSVYAINSFGKSTSRPFYLINAKLFKQRWKVLARSYKILLLKNVAFKLYHHNDLWRLFQVFNYDTKKWVIISSFVSLLCYPHRENDNCDIVIYGMLL